MPLPALPQYCPTPRELDDLELLVTGALAPTVVFNEPDSPITLSLPDEVVEQAVAAGAVELVDPEGLPLAQVTMPGGTIEPLTQTQYGPFRHLYLSPAETRRRYHGRTFVPLVDALTGPQVAALSAVGPLVLVPLVGHGTPEMSATGLIRATLAAAARLPAAEVVAIALATHGDPDLDHDLGVQVLENYAHGDPVIGVADDPKGAYSPEIAAIVEFERPAPADQGLVLFFTGLSGSGKSTLARALMDRLLEHGTRTVTSLDGDVVRRNLSAGLTFSKEDRETNIRRIGWVAAEIARHGGVAVCSPIAPFDETRQQVRAMVDEAGGAFFLVHVATPLEECERRDRKGLYAKARRGEIPEFTGISSPYEEPADADVRVDTTGRTIEAALDDVIEALSAAGYLDLQSRPDPLHGRVTPVVEVRAERASKPPAPPSVEQRAPASVVETPAAKPPSSTPVVEEGRSPVSKPLEPSSPPVVEQRAPASVVETPAANAPAPGAGVSTSSTTGPRTPNDDSEPTPVVEVRAERASKPPIAASDSSTPHDARPLRVLYICTANICRSPFMELASRHLVGPNAPVTFTSAGTRGFKARPMSADMAATLARRGVPGATGFRSRAFNSDLMLHADLILTAEGTHRQFILDDHPAAFRKVFTLGQFAQSIRATDSGLSGRELIAAVVERRGSSAPGLDIPDPYNQGPEAAEACAIQIDDLLGVVVPALTGQRKITT